MKPLSFFVLIPAIIFIIILSNYGAILFGQFLFPQNRLLSLLPFGVLILCYIHLVFHWLIKNEI